MNIVCVVVDGLQAAYLGTYGNTWVGTPHLDALAAQGFVFDQAFATCPTLAGFYRGAWLGRPAATVALDASSAASPSRGSLPALLSKAGYHTLLVTDEPEVLSLPGAGDFVEQMSVGSEDQPEEAADSDESTAMAATIAAAMEAWQQAPAPQPLGNPPRGKFMWLHLRGLLGPWDASYERREQYAAEDDPEPPQWIAPPHRSLGADADPDELLGVRQAYAAQVATLDALLGSLASLMEVDGQPPLLCLLGCRGYPLGVHRQLGHPTGLPPQLYGETVHIPWLMRFPGANHAAGRTSALVEPGDLPATLLDASGLSTATAESLIRPEVWLPSLLPVIAGEASETRDRLLLASPGKDAPLYGLKTPAWYLIERSPASAGEGTTGDTPETILSSPWELYAKPDDRWEINDVSPRLADVAERLAALLQEQRRVLAGEAAEPSPLDDDLRNTYR